MSHQTSEHPDSPTLASSSQSAQSPPTHERRRHSEDEIDDADDLLADDYLNGNSALDGQVSFKRAAKAAKPSFTSRFLSSPFSSSRNPTPSSGSSDNDAPETRRRNGIQASANTILSYLNSSALDPTTFGLHDVKDATGLDWYVEGPGRRVGYDNLTAIDWIYEYAKERTRRQHLSANSTGLVGQLKLAADASQIWWVLVGSGITVGAIAAGIDVASDWLGDLKTGVCSNVQDGGRFYLNKVFCCWGAESLEACADWRSWGQFLQISNRGGSYVLGYLFFVMSSVSGQLFTIAGSRLQWSGLLCILCFHHGQPLFVVRETVWHT